jgi:hypothetical protein
MAPVKTANGGPANRGKYCEKKVKEILEYFEKRNMTFTYNRCLDAHAAGGRFQAQAGDFQAFVKLTVAYSFECAGLTKPVSGQDWFQASRNFILECKEVAHSHLLPPKNYSADKVARVQKRVLAGTEAIVVVLHKKPTFVYRLVPFSVFTQRPARGSWDLSAYPTYLDVHALQKALGEFMGVTA